MKNITSFKYIVKIGNTSIYSMSLRAFAKEIIRVKTKQTIKGVLNEYTSTWTR